MAEGQVKYHLCGRHRADDCSVPQAQQRAGGFLKLVPTFIERKPGLVFGIRFGHQFLNPP
jgi:hypothetical protein